MMEGIDEFGVLEREVVHVKTCDSLSPREERRLANLGPRLKGGMQYWYTTVRIQWECTLGTPLGGNDNASDQLSVGGD